MSKHLGPYMPLFWDDFIGGTVWFGAPEIGAYLLLLHQQWAEGAIEPTPINIERTARLEYDKLQRVLAKFDVLPNGYLRNARLHEIREERIAYVVEQRRKSELAAKAKKEKAAREAAEREARERELEELRSKSTGTTRGKSSGKTRGKTTGTSRGKSQRLSPPSPSPSPLSSTSPKDPDGKSHRDQSKNHVSLNAEYGTLRKGDIPAVTGYEDIHAIADPIVAALAVTEEPPSRGGWKAWVKKLASMRKAIGIAKADKRFRSILSEVFGEYREGEIDNPAAILNKRLQAWKRG